MTMKENENRSMTVSPSVSIGVVGICGVSHLARCLEALTAQRDAPPFDVTVVYDPHLGDVPVLAGRFPHVRFIAAEGEPAPVALASRVVHETKGDILLLTEDSCCPDPGWVRSLCDVSQRDRAACGGTVDVDAGVPPVEWAFYYVDFFRYMPPVRTGPHPALTVCNVAYRREHLEAIRPIWQDRFHETVVHEALRHRVGPLWLSEAPRVTVRRRVTFRDAVRERYVFGRLFGCKRLESCGFLPRVYYSLLAPVLPVLLLGRMTRRALAAPGRRVAFARALPALVTLVFAWAWGEWLGSVTRRPPPSLVAAQEIAPEPAA
jgi:hypothetical protein